jgi:hypothetical protein
VTTEVYRSGGTYLVVRGALGRLVRVHPEPSPALDVGSIMAHVHTQGKGWTKVDPADVPADVQAVANDREWPDGR